MSQTTTAPFELERLGIVMEPDPAIPEEAEGTLNPGAARGRDGHLYLFPRTVGRNNYSRIGIARVLFDDAGNPTGVERLGYALEPSEPYELRPREGTGGCEDPRVTYVEPLDTYVMCYAAWGPHGPRVAIAVSDDLMDWRRLGVADFEPDRDPLYGVEFDEYHNKDATFFPRAVTAPDGRAALAMMHRPVYTEEDIPRGVDDLRPSMWISYCPLEAAQHDERALTHMRMHHVLIDPEHPWEALRIGGGTQPVLTPLGWLVVYHGASGFIPTDPALPKQVHYCAGALVLDEHDPLRVLYRSENPTLCPETPEETQGVVNDVVFPEGADDRGDGRVDIYYGMADTRIGAARLHVPEQLPAG